MSALAVDPSEVLRSEMDRLRRENARLAAMVLLAEPERIADRDIGSFLLEVIPYLDRDTASGWLARAGVNPWRACSDLSRLQRHLIAGQLARFSQAPVAVLAEAPL